MGSSTSAMVFYGYLWNEKPGFDIAELDNRTVLRVLESRRRASAGTPAAAAAPDAGNWAEQRQAEDELRREIGIGVSTHGIADEVMPLVYAYGTNSTVWAMDPRPLDQAAMRPVDPGWKQALDRFLAEHGIVPPPGASQPGWWLAAYAEY